MSSPPDVTQTALAFLKGKDNPFANLARPQRQDDYFLDLHVPELLSAERRQLWQIIDRYRLSEYRRASDLPATAVVTILGERGSGKTHLLQSLPYRDDGKTQILVRPSYFNAQMPIEEYLLSHLVRTLIGPDEVYGTSPIDDVAAALVQRLLGETLRRLGPTDRLFASAPSRWQRWRLLLGGGRPISARFERLADALEDSPGASDIRTVIRRHMLSPQRCFRLLQGHLQRFETGKDSLAALRRALYDSMARAVLLDERETLGRLLEGEYTQLDTGTSTRFEVVNRALHAITEICALVRQPIVFAFDNLERLLGPQNQFDEKLAQSFWSSLAQGVDNSRGLLILLYAEYSFFERAAKFMDSFAQDRLNQGVPLPGHGPVSIVRLDPPTSSDLRLLIKGRVQHLLGEFPAGAELADIFPFDESFFQKQLPSSQTLRSALYQLRDEYSRRVYARTPAAKPIAAIHWEGLLESTWNEQLAAVGRKVTGSLAGSRAQLHAGLGGLLQQFATDEAAAWRLVEVQPVVSIGDNPTYGLVTLMSWQRTEGSVDNDGTLLKVGAGFLLASGPGMAVDLRTKFDFFRRPIQGEHLLILWPASRDGDDPLELLPPGTRAAWDESRHKKKTTLRRVQLDELRALLAFPDWLNKLQAAADQPPPSGTLQEFIRKRFRALLELVLPPVREEEVEHADAN